MQTGKTSLFARARLEWAPMNSLFRTLSFALLFPLAQTGCAAGLPHAVDEAIARHKADRDALGIWVQAVDSSEPILAWNADEPQNPASVMKLVTTAAALDILGPAYTWPTDAYVTAPIKNGVLQGDLVLKGYGNPMFQTEDLWKLLRGLREKGIKNIQGDLVLDNTFFNPPPEDPAAFDGQPYKPYNALPDALLLNQRATRFVFQPDPASGKVMVASDPPAPGVRIENRITASRKSCAGSDLPDMHVASTGQGAVVEFVGSYALDCGTRDLYRVVAEPQDMMLGAFRSLWEELGGQFKGDVRIDSTPAGARKIDSIDSRPLADVIRPMNKWSSNVMTRQVLLTLSAEQFGPPGNPDKGQRAIDYWLGTQGFQWPEFVLGNGSGLSRESRISARHLGELLMHVYSSPYMPEFTASLPVAGVDGTVRKRMKHEEIAGRAHLKTGTLNGVRALAGYVLSRSGRRYVVVTLHNQPGVENGIGSRVQDALLKWVYEQP